MHIFPVFAGMVRTRPLRKRICVNFPRIRGDGPILPNIHVLQGEFSPYSRGWSHRNSLLPHARCIFPVFAGMVRRSYGYQSIGSNFPRIRGDGPVSLEMVLVLRAFSPYSRGWSPSAQGRPHRRLIFPVFAGMVPSIGSSCRTVLNFPRIRGDGPCCRGGSLTDIRFSPYSRGWSPNLRTWSASASIFPVFAGMVLMRNCMPCSLSHFPRIRGDGPCPPTCTLYPARFSPYSRGWSCSGIAAARLLLIFPVFAGMVPCL